MRSIYLFNMRGKPALTIRQRLIYARLSPLRRPVPAQRLEAMLGGLVYRQTISDHLEKLQQKGLVEKRKGGWVALEPTGEIEEEFVRLKESPEDGRWHGCFASWRLPLPARKPFPNARNATELYTAYWLIRNLQVAEAKKPKPGKALKVKRIAALLGVCRSTASKLVMTLRDKKLLDGDKIAAHDFVLQTGGEDGVKARKDVNQPDDGDALDIRVNRLNGRDEIHALVAQLTSSNFMFRGELYAVVGEALREHKKNGFPGDGSALVLNWLGARLRTRQGIEDGEQQKLRDDLRLAERQAAAIAQLNKEIEAERARPKVRDLLAAKVLPGENFKAMHLKYIQATDAQLEAAWDNLKDAPRLVTKDELLALVRGTQAVTGILPPAPLTVKTEAAVCKPVDSRRRTEPVIVPTAEDDARVMAAVDFDELRRLARAS
jgi:Mn-dependent DtxR family transcriptional regulator